MQHIGKRLLRTEGDFWRFYTRDSVEAQLELASHCHPDLENTSQVW
jgi:hypothetical protein